MKLVDENIKKIFLSNLKIEETVWDLANSIVGLSQLGNKSRFIGKVSDDDFGNNYEQGLKKEKLITYTKKRKKVSLL